MRYKNQKISIKIILPLFINYIQYIPIYNKIGVEMFIAQQIVDLMDRGKTQQSAIQEVSKKYKFFPIKKRTNLFSDVYTISLSETEYKLLSHLSLMKDLSNDT